MWPSISLALMLGTDDNSIYAVFFEFGEQDYFAVIFPLGSYVLQRISRLL